MKNFRLNLVFILAAIFILILTSCNEKKTSQVKQNKISQTNKIKVDEGFKTYVNAYTSGAISNKSNIKIILMQPVTSAVEGEVVSERLFEFTPKIDGSAFWVDNQTIEFRPDEKLPAGQSYIASFNLGKLMEVPGKFTNFKFDFIVLKQNIFVSYKGIVASGKDATLQEVTGEVRTSDFTSLSEIQACFKASQNGASRQIKFEHAGKPKTFAFIVKDVERGDKKSIVNISWDGTSIGSSSKGDKEVEITPLGEFKLLSVSLVTTPGTYFSLQFSDPVDENQDLEGYIQLQSRNKLQFVKNGNEIKAYPTRKARSVEFIKVYKGLKNSFGNELEKTYSKSVQFSFARPEVKLLGDGVIIPSSGSVSFPFKAINLKAVNIRILKIYEHNINQFFQENRIDGTSELARVGRIVYDDVVSLVSDEALDYGKWNSFNIDLSDFIEREPGAIYRVMVSFERYQSLYPCSDTTEVVAPLKRRKLNFDEDFYFDEDYWYVGYASYRDREDPCKDDYYKYYQRSISASLLASNFGLIAKESTNNKYYITVTDLRTAEPLSGITVEAYNFQNIKIGEGKTNSSGAISTTFKGRPYLLIAKQGKHRGYLRVDKGSSLSMSLFDVSGSKIDKGIKGFTYGERGVWRPGDTLFLSFMLEDKQKVLPKSHPVIMELYDPTGQLYEKKVSTKGVEGLYSFKFVTHKKDKTGSWYTITKVGNSSFMKYLKIETIKPNRIRMDYDLDEIITAQKGFLKTNLSANWLYGSPAANLKTSVELNVSPVITKFKGYEGFNFDDRSVRFSFQQPIIVESKTNAAGLAPILFKWNIPRTAPGMLKLAIQTKVYEPGGDYSQDFQSKLYSPFESYVGLKLEKGKSWLNAIDTEDKLTLPVVSVDQQGKPLNRKVKVSLYKKRGNWWWESSSGSEITRYVNRNSYEHLTSQYFNIVDGRGNVSLKFPYRGWGRYMVIVTDTESGHTASETFYGDYYGWWDASSSSDNQDAASAINIELSKKSYQVGEEIECKVPSGGLGNLLVSVEKGDQVLEQMWVKAEPTSTTFRIPATKEMAPNIYVSVMLLQPHGQTDNSLPIRMFGVVPVNVYDENTKLKPVISSPDELQPESEFKLSVSEKNGKAMAYTLAVVDEGLLSLTRYKTPKPWPTFYRKEALSTRTWDMYQYVMSAITGKMTSLYAIGGDEGLDYKDEADANRFKPVVTYLGPFFLEQGKTKQHTVQIPNYIGAVRAMVVAGYDGAYGSTEKEMQVKQPLMVLSTLPRVLGPSEKVKIPISVIVMSDEIKEVTVTTSTNDMLTCDTENEQTITFEEPGEKTVYFDYSVAHKLGIAEFRVNVSSGEEKAFEEVELSVRTPNPLIQKAKEKMLNGGEVWDFTYETFGVRGSQNAEIQFSSIPNLNLGTHLEYLIRYPHGCIEQTTSAVFPQLHLNKFVKLTSDEEKNIQKNITAALNKYKSFQLSSGAFSYWPGRSYLSEWGTNYAGHFIVEAKKAGYSIPSGILESWIKYQKDAADNWDRINYTRYGRYSGDLNQAYRLYTLALAGKPAIGAMNRLRNDSQISNVAAWRLSAAYAIIGRNDVAMELAKHSTVIEPYRSMSYTFGSNTRDLAMILESMYYLDKKDEAAGLIKDIAGKLGQGWHSTQTRAYALLAISRFLNTNNGEGAIKLSININGKEQEVEFNNSMFKCTVDKKELEGGSVSIKNIGEAMVFVNYNQSGVPLELNDAPKQTGLNMTITYSDMMGNPLDVSSLKQGTDFKAKVTLKHPGIRGDYKEIALNQVFPSGWQIVNKRVGQEAGVTATDNKFTYQDFRDDRVYTYFDLNRSKSKTFEIHLNATFAGKYYMPAVSCAPMYDESVQAILPGKWVEVVQ